jgi:sulfatase maturation enzyme AslB (radical SAM superfamily)
MSFEKTFCPSPWFHMSISNQGRYGFCRWAEKSHNINYPTIEDCSPIEFFQSQSLNSIRTGMLDGDYNPACCECNEMEKHNKISGREKQLLKIGAQANNFSKTLISSDWVNEFKFSAQSLGSTKLTPVDWQIDLGNYCNSGCVFCSPASSSKLAAEWKQLGLINKLPNNSWCDNEEKLKEFIKGLISIPKLRYMHFIGGETLITPAFKQILNALIESNIVNITIGFTTNLTTWDDEILDLLRKFESVNVGLSIESLHRVNDYVRWPSNIEVVSHMLSKWVNISAKNNWSVQLRITPTIFTIKYLDTVYDYAYKNNLTTESCNFIARPEFMRPSVLPKLYRQEAIDNLEKWINLNQTQESTQVINIRNPNFSKEQNLQDAQSYVTYLKTQPDESYRLPDLVRYIKLLESTRNNSILNYMPEYEEFLRSAGY